MMFFHIDAEFCLSGRSAAIACISAMLTFSCIAKDAPLLQMRLRANDTQTEEIWKSNLCAFASRSDCCDEVWFSTGTGVPDLDWHRDRAKILMKAAQDVKRLGIAPSLQFQATLGHGDAFGTAEMYVAKRWTGWTDWKGFETQFCNCPRQAAFHAYLKEVSRVYALIGFSSLWIDDDLRYRNHRPADNAGVHLGCWCDTCIAEFNRETKGNWSRDELGKAVESDSALAARWRTFSIEGLCGVAHTIASAFKEVSPSTMMGLQQGNWTDAVDSVRAILKTLHETSGKPVGYRPGGGAYYDLNLNSQIVKSMRTGRFRELLGNPSWVGEWTPEIESWPRTYYSRSGQSVLVEGFTALMYGMNRISYFISNSEKEAPELFARQFWKPLADAAPVLRGYARAIAGCHAVGCSLPAGVDVGEAVLMHAGVPVLPGVGITKDVCTTNEVTSCPWTMTSKEVQKLRADIDDRCGTLPAMLVSPFFGLMLPHVDNRGALRTVAIVNERIESQRNVRVMLRNIPDGVEELVWHEMRRPDRRLKIQRKGRSAVVEIPEIGAWNAGYLGFDKKEERQ